MVSVARLTLGLPDTDNKTIRIPYGANSPTGSAPTHNPTNSICYIYVTPTDDGYGQQHYLQYKNGATIDSDMTEVDEYTEEYAVIFSCYGADAFDWARLIRDGLYGNIVKRFLGTEKLYLKAGIPPIVPAREIINTQWVMRCDVTATFYSYVRIERENTMPPIEHVNITFKIQNKSFPYKEE